MKTTRHKTYAGPGCPVEATLEVIGGKWKGVILHYLLRDGVKRFGELRKVMPDATQRMLTNQLRELEADGVVHREVYAEVPPRVEYSLTEFGKTLAPLIEGMRKWGLAHLERKGGGEGSTSPPSP